MPKEIAPDKTASGNGGSPNSTNTVYLVGGEESSEPNNEKSPEIKNVQEKVKKEPKKEKEPKKSKKEKEETVSVGASMLSEILDKVNEQSDVIKRQQEKIDKLTYASDKARLQKWDEKNKGSLIRTATVSTMEGKLVAGWKMVKDDVYVDSNNVIHEDQVIQLFLVDPKTGMDKIEEVQYSYREFYRRMKRIKGEIVSHTVNSDGSDIRKIRFDDGLEADFNVLFLNA